MSLITAGLKFIARSANDLLYNREKRNAPKVSYRETGKAMQQASGKGKYINGAKLYRENRTKNLERAKVRHANREKFISEL